MFNDESANTSENFKIESPIPQKKLSPAKQKRANERLERFEVKVSSNFEMAHAKISCGYFVYAGDAATLGSRWESWNERFDLFLEATGEKDLAKSKASYLILMGEEAFEIHKTKRNAGNTDTLVEIRKYMKEYFVAKRSEYSETTEFRRAMRLEGETCSDYVQRLRALATYCKYGVGLEKQIELQFVVGCNMEEAQREFCRKDDLDLAQVVAIAQGYERLNSSVRGLNQAFESERSGSRVIHQINQAQGYKAQGEFRRQEKPQAPRTQGSEQKCGYCGNRGHNEKSECPAYGQTCNCCGIKNHYAKMCRKKGETGQESRRQGGQSGQQRNQQKSVSFKDTSIKKVSMQPDPVDQDELAAFRRWKDGVNYGLFAIGEEKLRRINLGPKADISVCGLVKNFLIDTGSPVNVIDESCYNELKDKPTLSLCNTRFFGYGPSAAKQPLPIMGQFKTVIAQKGKKVDAAFVVIKGTEECLLSFKTANDLGIIMMSEEIA